MPKVQMKEDIWTKYRQTGDAELRNEILLSYVHIVKYIVQRLVPSSRNYPDFDDLMGYGIIGMIDAIDKFDASKGVKFETYATLRVKGAIIDQLRKQDWVPRGIRVKVKGVTKCYEQLEAQFGRPATDQEVADAMSITVDELREIIDESYTFNVVYMDEQIMDVIKLSDSPHGGYTDPESEYEEKELKAIMAGLIDSLGEKERLVVTLYYYEELTLKEIGRILGVSESRVSQIHSKTLMRLRSKLINYIGRQGG